MTENKLLNEFLDINKKPLDKRGYFYDMDLAYKSVEIAEEFAIGFAEWCDNNYFRMGNTAFWAESTNWEDNTKLTTKELLEIYKKEKGL